MRESEGFLYNQSEVWSVAIGNDSVKCFFFYENTV